MDHKITEKLRYVFDQYIRLSLVLEKGYRFDIKNNIFTIEYEYAPHDTTKQKFDEYQDKKNQLLDYVRRAAKEYIRQDLFEKVMILQKENGVNEHTEECF